MPHLKKTELYESVFKSIPDIILVVDSHLVVFFCNERSKLILGTDIPVGSSLAQFTSSPSDLNKIITLIDEISTKDISSTTLYLKGEKSPHQFALTGSKVSDCDLFALVFRDIRDEEISETLRMHADRVEAIQHINSQISHELRSPLSTIHLDLEFMKEQVSLVSEGPVTKDIVKKCSGLVLSTIAEAMEQLDYMLNILSNLSDYSRLSVVSEEIINVKDVIEVTVKILKVATKMKDLPADKFVVDIEGLNDAMVKMNKMWLSQVIWNLCMNAYEATPSGGIIKLVGKIKGKDVILRVINPGHIPEENLDKIFIPYFTSKKKGGLGLAIVRSILFRSDGYVWATNYGDQVILSVKLPLCKKEIDSEEVVCDDGYVRVATNRELVASDDPADVQLSIN
jgi:signal transduction histidine kinase